MQASGHGWLHQKPAALLPAGAAATLAAKLPTPLAPDKLLVSAPAVMLGAVGSEGKAAGEVGSWTTNSLVGAAGGGAVGGGPYGVGAYAAAVILRAERAGSSGRSALASRHCITASTEPSAPENTEVKLTSDCIDSKPAEPALDAAPATSALRRSRRPARR